MPHIQINISVYNRSICIYGLDLSLIGLPMLHIQIDLSEYIG